MTNKIIFSIKPKMFTVYDFHMDFQFWSKKVLPRDFQMGLTLPWLWEGCDWCGMDPKSWKMDFRDLYMSGHVWLSVVLVYPNLSAFWTHPIKRLKAPIHKEFLFSPPDCSASMGTFGPMGVPNFSTKQLTTNAISCRVSYYCPLRTI